MMPISDTAVNGCDCPGSTPVNGSLIDGIIPGPNIDTRQQGWASGLFTVNRNGQDSIMIGFEFSQDLSLRLIEIVLFHCPVQGIGITGVNIYSSFVFPAFMSTASTLLVTYNTTPSDNCQYLSTISIPLQLQSMMPISLYFIEFLFTGASSVNQINWLFLGEISFSDEAPTSTSPTPEGEIYLNNDLRLDL